MKKRLLAAWLAALLALCCPTALAEETPAALFRLISRDAQGMDTLLGTAVLVDESVLLTATSATRCDGQLLAVGPGGEYAVQTVSALPEQPLVSLLALAEAPPVQPQALSQGVRRITCTGLTQGGALLTAPISQITALSPEQTDCILFTAPEALLPGSVLLDESGCLAGITAAAYAEGIGHFMGVTVADVAAALSMPPAAAPSPADPDWITGFSVTAEAGVLTVDWSDCGVTLAEDEQLLAVLYDTGNTYLECLEITGDDTTCSQPLVPGRTYEIYLRRSRKEVDFTSMLPESAAQRITLPPAEPFDRFDFRNQELYLGHAPAQRAQDALYRKVDPLAEITRQSLTDPQQAIFLQAVSTYAVGQDEMADSVIALFTPENYCFATYGGFLFLPDFCEGDVWNTDITDLLGSYLDFCETGSMAAGEYRLCVYLDSALAGELTWTLE